MIERAVRALAGMRGLVHTEVIPAREAVPGTLERDLAGPLKDYIARRKIRLYSHQCETINFLRGGKNVIITTPTASGKTLAFTLPVMEALLGDSAGRALFIYPTKALANDQLKFLAEMDRATGSGLRPAFTTGTPPRGEGPPSATNRGSSSATFHELHHVLPWHYKWEKFFRGLKFIVMDEAHRYRGVAGSNIAYLVRRLRQGLPLLRRRTAVRAVDGDPCQPGRVLRETRRRPLRARLGKRRASRAQVLPPVQPPRGKERERLHACRSERALHPFYPPRPADDLLHGVTGRWPN